MVIQHGYTILIAILDYLVYCHLSHLILKPMEDSFMEKKKRCVSLVRLEASTCLAYAFRLLSMWHAKVNGSSTP